MIEQSAGSSPLSGTPNGVLTTPSLGSSHRGRVLKATQDLSASEATQEGPGAAVPSR